MKISIPELMESAQVCIGDDGKTIHLLVLGEPDTDICGPAIKTFTTKFAARRAVNFVNIHRHSIGEMLEVNFE
jgi:hypothetical protein